MNKTSKNEQAKIFKLNLLIRGIKKIMIYE